MKLTREGTKFPDVSTFIPTVHLDARGFFKRSYSKREYEPLGVIADFVEDNISSSVRGVLRGLHFDARVAKLIQVVSGDVFDVIVDLRKTSSTFKQWQSFELTGENCRQLFVPAGFAHGFYTISEVAIMLYKHTDYFDPAFDGVVRWSDPQLAIDWPFEKMPLLSARDENAPLLSELEKNAESLP